MKNDIWLKTFCPEDACLTEAERIDLPVDEAAGDEDAWLATFCPENTCEVTAASQLP